MATAICIHLDGTRHRNAFRDIMSGRLDRKYLRICAVYRLLKRGRISSKAHAIALLSARKVEVPKATVEMWLSDPLKHLAISA